MIGLKAMVYNVVWDEVYTSIALGNAKGYDQATIHLCDLHDLAERQGDLAGFNAKLTELSSQYKNRPALVKRFRGNG